ncbi:MAG: PolC-type DNA polymerase III [Lachnospiraceae bacterium]|nr:PolC-type DNA polymerase III [Lachnospiraceae bacterium]
MNFLEVFPTLILDDELKRLLADVKVDSVKLYKNNGCLKISISNGSAVSSSAFSRAESEIEQQLLKNRMKARIEYDDGYEYVENKAAFIETPAKPKSNDKPQTKYKRKTKKTDEGMLYGQDFDGALTPISDILTETRNIIVKGEVFGSETSKTKTGINIFRLDITDYNDSISMKIFLAEGEEDLPSKFKNGMTILVNGKVEYDNYEGELLITRVHGIKESDEPIFTRMDNAPEKRVELHLHTQFSDMDALTDVGKVIDTAVSWGHRAMAITDHGVVQAFPPAFHKLQDLKSAYKKKEKELDFKLLYGCEGYLVDDDDDPVIKSPDQEMKLFKVASDDEDDPDVPTPEEQEVINKVKKAQYYHIILIAKNEIGRINLYRLVSYSHINYFSRRPRIPRSLLMKYREGIIVGSACIAGELCEAILNGASDEELEKIAGFYDYLEIQPVANNGFLIRNYEDEKKGKKIRGHKVKDEEGIRDINRKILSLGDKLGLKVAATGDVHFLHPRDEIYRKIILASQKYEDADAPVPIYFRTTEEMLDEFSYLGEDRAYEVVVTNTNQIADMVEYIEPVRPDKCPPVIEDSDKKLTDIVYENAHKLYGDELPKVVADRIERELHSIISNGYAVLYIIAMELVLQSVKDGYLVGSRGSVGSSLVATLSGITEVNPLKPHYRCPNCRYSEFDSEEVNKYAGGAGCDMPDKVCPVCGEPLVKDGFDIPFETFMGFKGDKEPDIDLNFSGEYQARAHANTEKLFGKGHTFRAGTISTLKDKTVFGFVKHYMEEHGRQARKCEINRLIQGCMEVKRSTGQHPGGIVVLPHGEEIFSFTPVQHPANDATKNIITTHFEYHSIDHNLLKLDELGHDDPTMIKVLEDMTGYSAKQIKLDNPDVMKLFEGTEVLGITPDDINGVKLGVLGVPEFGTNFVMQMLLDTKPKNYSDLVRIAGLSHGTDVWTNNAEELVKSGQATLSTCICTRDDIMLYLMQKGVEPAMSFNIMEAVRKGKVAGGKAKDTWPVWESAMKEHGVPDWYLWSCNRIQYMFPKAHAVAYVMMAYRIAYYKIFYPLAYYAAFFSIRASAFNYELMCQGRQVLLDNMESIRMRMADGDNSQKTEELYKNMHNVLEMYARGFEFMPIDIYKAKADRFQIIDNKIMPSFMSIDGMGEKAAQTLEAEATKGRFTSREDLKIRTKISSTLADKMYQLGILGSMPESSQLSIYDFLG